MDWNLSEAGRETQRIKSRSLMQLVSRKKKNTGTEENYIECAGAEVKLRYKNKVKLRSIWCKISVTFLMKFQATDQFRQTLFLHSSGHLNLSQFSL
jgi:hypothetical protein